MRSNPLRSVLPFASILALALEARVAAPWSEFSTPAFSAAVAAPAADAADSIDHGGSLAARGWRTARNFASDTWLVVSSPARINRHGALQAVAVLAVGGAVYAYDEELLESSIRNREDPVWDAIQDVGSFVQPTGYMGRTIPYYVGAAGLGYLFDVKLLREIPIQIVESHLISGGVRNSAKLFLGRRRPFEERGPYHFEFNGGTSFPSGHTSVMFEIATVLSHHARSTPATVLFYTLAATGALERVHSRNHWPSDLILSAVSGTMIARTVVRRHEERQSRLRAEVFLDRDGVPRLAVSLPLSAPAPPRGGPR